MMLARDLVAGDIADVHDLADEPCHIRALVLGKAEDMCSWVHDYKPWTFQHGDKLCLFVDTRSIHVVFEDEEVELLVRACAR